jgi:hypothetical protein
MSKGKNKILRKRRVPKRERTNSATAVGRTAHSDRSKRGPAKSDQKRRIGRLRSARGTSGGRIAAAGNLLARRRHEVFFFIAAGFSCGRSCCGDRLLSPRARGRSTPRAKEGRHGRRWGRRALLRDPWAVPPLLRAALQGHGTATSRDRSSPSSCVHVFVRPNLLLLRLVVVNSSLPNSAS